MSNPSKRKGTAFQRDVVNYLKAHGWPKAEQRALAGRFDKGDILNGPEGWTLELKAWADVRGAMAAGVDQAAVEKQNTGTPLAAAIVKRPRRSTSEAYVVMSLEEWIKMVNA